MPTLRYHLASMLQLARKFETRPQVRTLPGGLVLEVVQLATGDVQLTLERREVPPSDVELATVLKHWPEAVPPGVNFARRKEGLRHALVGRWPRPVEIAEQL